MKTSDEEEYIKELTKRTPLYLRVLAMVIQNPNATNQEIADYAGCHPRTVQKILLKLEKEERLKREVTKRERKERTIYSKG